MKQRRQALLTDPHKLPLKTLYRGYGSTVIRDLPFGLIQMPLWEYFKFHWKKHMKRECTPLEGALCGSLSGRLKKKIDQITIFKLIKCINIYLKLYKY